MRLKRQSSIEERSPFTPEEESILITLLYSAVFSFPLTRDELWKYLISQKKIDNDIFEKSLQKLDHLISQEGEYLCMKGDEQIRAQRFAHRKEIQKKMHLAQQAATLLSSIPTIQFIGLSGGLAAQNVTAADDIDFFIITKPNTVYTTRLLVLILLEIAGLRRSRRDRIAPNKICVNLLIDDQELAWPSNKHDVYTAREIAQVYPLFERQKTFNRFITANEWVVKLLPNAFTKLQNNIPHKRESIISLCTARILAFPITEWLFRHGQKWKMEKHKTTEIVTSHRLAFHPRDYRAEVLAQLKLKMKDFGLLTKI